jgi:hypothetical protein
MQSMLRGVSVSRYTVWASFGAMHLCYPAAVDFLLRFPSSRLPKGPEALFP